MTAIVGWLCKDGVVIGSDSAITFGTGNLFTIGQTGDKISIIRDRIIVAGSGEVGHQQRFCDIVQTAFDQNLFRKKYMDVGRVLSQNMNNDLAATRAERGRYCALLAYGSDDGFHLCEFTLRDFQPEWKDKNIKFASIGCGQPITDPFLGFMKKIFWNDNELPTVAQAKFITFWTLSNVCELSPGGVKGPVHMTQVSKNSSGHSMAIEVGPEELEEHAAIMKDAIAHVGGFKDQMTGKAAVPIPSMPTK
jgi:hypothetical protein